ncbi:ABC transporter permease [Algoriphagus lacus]|uniref:ABC transporter permease n=1 Tax=Algoriphagus lacus TaxID=2056311 RepID=A0A418PMJ9_9BACT|nr:ABC transporter permease [Algoriphagus lacus]RIW12938.1 ABC transporter permease [Algoriphagus lacus]
MLRHYFLLAFRNFQKFKSIFLINLLGLTIGLTTVVLIGVWVKDELSINRYHTNSDRIYTVLTNHDNAGGIVTWSVTPAQMAESMKAELPQVEMAAGVSPFISGVVLESAGEKLTADGLFVDQEYLDMFSHEFLVGNKSKALTGINSVTLSETLAKNLFGSAENAIGKSLKWQVFDFKNEVEVTGVYRDFGSLDVEKPQFMLAFPYFKAMLGDGAHWDNFNASTYVLLEEGTDEEAFNLQIAGFIKAKRPTSNVTPFVQLYGDTYLHGTYEGGKVAGGRINYVWIFSGVALFILLIACINFMNLTTARSLARSKEIGVKKSMGASKGGIFGQFMVESLLLVFLALMISLVAVFILQPVFNQVTGKQLSLEFGLTEVILFTGIWIFTGLLAGIYPSLYLSRFRPVQIMKINLKGNPGELMARKGLVVFQFAISMLLIIGVLVIGKQMNFIQNQNLGYDQSHLLQIPSESISQSQLPVLLEQIKAVPGVENASSLNHPLIGLESSTIGLSWEGKSPEEEVKFENISVNLGLIETMGFEILSGRTFSPDFGEENTKIILNEEAVRVIGFENPIGQVVNLWGNDMEVIGVIKNFHFESLKEKVKPAFIKYDPNFAQNIMVRIQSENQQETLTAITGVFQNVVGQKASIFFMDEAYQTLYDQEQKVSALSKYFGVVAIFLSCLGLFGLAAFTAESRKKEIGVRKVLGASIGSILSLITRDFVQLVAISVLLALPIAWYFADSWLQTYALQTNLSWWIFAGSGILLMVIAMLTVSFQAFRAASSNPVNSLRSE